ncbi:hypothetical protein PCE1_003134 [Barthelona sp. PCE]
MVLLPALIIVFVLGFVLGKFYYGLDDKADVDLDKNITAEIKEDNLEEECKMVFAVNQSLKMGKGKIGAQVAHACLGSFKQAVAQCPEVVHHWELTGQTKVCVKVPDDEELTALYERVRSAGLPCCLIRDAGRTQIAASSKTAVGIGPLPISIINDYTGHYKLL